MHMLIRVFWLFSGNYKKYTSFFIFVTSLVKLGEIVVERQGMYINSARLVLL